MMRLKAMFLGLVALLMLSGCSKKTMPLETVPSIDLKRYLGEWNEIARYENSFEKGCLGASATYSEKEDFIEVVNRCYDKNADMKSEAYGKAYVIENSNNARLKVSFFWPFYGNYWVIMLGDNYQYSVVGEPTRKYLWILSRDIKLEAEDKEKILSRLPEFGYDPDKLYWTEVFKR